jgi:Zn-dependent M28 family amino/carboxypeptidase
MSKYLSLCAFLLLLSAYASAQRASHETLRAHVTTLASGPGSRNYKDTEALNRAAEYIQQEFSTYSDSVHVQYYSVNGVTYQNIIAFFGDPTKERIVIGAHYDVCGDQPGADDNASGVAGLLELARMLKDTQSRYCIELVAYTLEEPPYFRTAYMGSYIHASSLKQNGIRVKGMISLEMIGYFDDRKGSQAYPLGIMKLFYGSRGNYISIVKQFGQGSFGRKFKRTFKRSRAIITKSVTAPSFVPGIDFSDHLNYYAFGYNALMITDTAFYRNNRYHESSDTPDTLDYEKMASVVNAVFAAVTGM